MPIRNGTHYHPGCPPEVILAIEAARLQYLTGRGYRLRIYYGDPASGRWWGDIESGYIGRSAGPMKVPILLRNKLSRGGHAILDHCIVKVEYANKRMGGVILDVIKEKEEADEQESVKRIH